MIRKKGTFSTIAVFIVLIIFFLIFFGGWNFLFGKATDKADENINFEGEEKKIIKDETETEIKIQETFEEFTSLLQKSKGNACLTPYNNFFNLPKEYVVILSPIDEGKNTYIHLMKEEKNQKKSIDGVTILDKIPCVIHAKNFYDNCIIGDDCENKNNIIEIESEITVKDKKIFFGEVEAELKDQSLMFQWDNEHICFFPTKDGGLVGTGIGAGCKAYTNQLNDKCLSEIKKKVEDCK